MWIVRKNQVLKQEFQVCKYTKQGEFIGVVSGMGRNKGTWNSTAKSKRTAQRWLKMLREDSDGFSYDIHEVN